MLPEDFPNMKGKQEKWIWKVEEFEEHSLELSYSMMENTLIVIHGDIWLFKYIPCFLSCVLYMGSLIFCTTLFLIFINELLKRKTRQLLGDRRIMYAEITGCQSVGLLFKSWGWGKWSIWINLNIQCLCLVSEDRFLFWFWIQVVCFEEFPLDKK